MFTYEFLQNYWWAIISLLGGLLVFLMFVQGGNSLIFITKDEEERQLIVNSTGRKWEFTFTTLVTFGGAFFASFPLFYSTSFGGAYWVWILLLVTFVFQAVSYEFQTKLGNLLGRNTFRTFLLINGCLGPFIVGAAVSTFFTGSDFIVNKAAVGESLAPTISAWGNEWHGLEALANPFTIAFGLTVMFLTQVLGGMYMQGSIEDERLEEKLVRAVRWTSGLFLAAFLACMAMLLTMPGYAVDSAGVISVEEYKYLHNFIQTPSVAIIFLLGVLFVLLGIGIQFFGRRKRMSIWLTGAGTVPAVMSLFLIAGYNGTAYYPSCFDLQSSLTISNSCSSEFTLRTMAWVSLAIPFVLAYIFFAWRAIDRRRLTRREMEITEDKY